MKRNMLQLALLGASVMCIGSTAYAASNPINQEYVQLSDADWAKVCESGNINSAQGCYGDIGSVAFSKVNRLTNNIIQTNSLRGSGPNTVWLRQVGHGTQCSAIYQYYEIYNASPTTTDWLVGIFLTTGQNYSLAGDYGIGYGGFPYYGGGTGVLTLLASGAAVGNHKDNPDHVYVSDYPQQVPTMYMVVVSANSAQNGIVTPFQQNPQVFLETDGLC